MKILRCKGLIKCWIIEISKNQETPKYYLKWRCFLSTSTSVNSINFVKAPKNKWKKNLGLLGRTIQFPWKKRTFNIEIAPYTWDSWSVTIGLIYLSVNLIQFNYDLDQNNEILIRNWNDSFRNYTITNTYWTCTAVEPRR